MRIVSNGAICAVNAREQRRQEKWRQHNMLKMRNRQLAREKNNGDKNAAERQERESDICR